MTLYPFTWPGSKYRARKFVTEHLPANKPEGPIQTYVEPFGGSGVVMLNRDPAPVEVFNDLDSNLVNFFQVLRERPEELQRALALTPYSREEFAEACEADLSDGDIDELERARLFFVRVQQSREMNGSAPSVSDWSYAIGISRRRMSKLCSSNISKVEGLTEVANRLRRIQIENASAIEIIERYDSEDTLFYCDPPYTKNSVNTDLDDNSYVSALTDTQHTELKSALSNIEGLAAVSGYDSDLYASLFDDWFIVHDTIKSGPSQTGTREYTTRSRQEVLWTNYDPDGAVKQSAVSHPSTPQASLEQWSVDKSSSALSDSD